MSSEIHWRQRQGEANECPGRNLSERLDMFNAQPLFEVIIEKRSVAEIFSISVPLL
jgi:hypothetical protein